MQTTVLEAQAHPHVLAERFFGPQGNGGKYSTDPRSGQELPLVRVMFMLQNYQHVPGRHAPPGADAGAAQSSALSLKSVPVQTGRIKHDLMVTWNDDATEVKSQWKFSADLFDAETRADMLALYRAMLEHVADDPDRPLAGLLVPSEDLRHPEKELLIESNTSF